MSFQHRFYVAVAFLLSCLVVAQTSTTVPVGKSTTYPFIRHAAEVACYFVNKHNLCNPVPHWEHSSLRLELGFNYFYEFSFLYVLLSNYLSPPLCFSLLHL